MTFAVTFTVDGNPVAKGRPRFAKRGKFVQTYTPQKTKDYESLVMDAASNAMGSSEPLETPVAIYLTSTYQSLSRTQRSCVRVV